MVLLTAGESRFKLLQQQILALSSIVLSPVRLDDLHHLLEDVVAIVIGQKYASYWE